MVIKFFDTTPKWSPVKREGFGWTIVFYGGGSAMGGGLYETYDQAKSECDKRNKKSNKVKS